MNKNIIAIAVIICFIGLHHWVWLIRKRHQKNKQIKIPIPWDTGSNQKLLQTSSLGQKFPENSFELKQAYDALSNDRKIIENYLILRNSLKTKSFFGGRYSSNTIMFQTLMKQSPNFAGYQVNSIVSIRVKMQSKIRKIYLEISIEIINLGIEFTSSKT